MSVSSVGSTASVGFRGECIPLDIAIDECVRELQKHLNLLQLHLRSLAAIVDQDAEFKEECAEFDKVDDELREMGWFFSDLRSFGEELISLPDTKEDKAWFKLHKVERKLENKKLELEHAEKITEEKKASKLAMKIQVSSIAEDDNEMKE